jgi:hypothetical protein
MFIKVCAVAVSRTRSNCRSLICLSVMIFFVWSTCVFTFMVHWRESQCSIYKSGRKCVIRSTWVSSPTVFLVTIPPWKSCTESWLQFSMLLRIILAMISQSSHPQTIWVSQLQQVHSHHDLQFRFSKFATRMCNHTDSPFSIYSQFLNWQQEA